MLLFHNGEGEFRAKLSGEYEGSARVSLQLPWNVNLYFVLKCPVMYNLCLPGERIPAADRRWQLEPSLSCSHTQSLSSLPLSRESSLTGNMVLVVEENDDNVSISLYCLL